MVKGNFWVGNLDFTNWFYFVFQPKNKALFPKPLNNTGFEYVMNHIQPLLGKASMSLEEFVVLFCFMYNETNFESLGEYGGSAYYQSKGYSTKSKGRGLIQITSDSVYRVVMSELGYDYDAMSAEALDSLFKDPKVYLPAVRIYLTHPLLAKSAWEKALQGDFYGFGMAISGQSTNYAEGFFKPRAEVLYNALRSESIKNSQILAYKPVAKKVAIGVGIIGIGVGIYYLVK